eukprot:755925-Hanusia_phi.AAC.2
MRKSGCQFPSQLQPLKRSGSRVKSSSAFSMSLRLLSSNTNLSGTTSRAACATAGKRSLKDLATSPAHPCFSDPAAELRGPSRADQTRDTRSLPLHGAGTADPRPVSILTPWRQNTYNPEWYVGEYELVSKTTGERKKRFSLYVDSVEPEQGPRNDPPPLPASPPSS